MSSECLKNSNAYLCQDENKKGIFLSIWFCKHSLICSGSDCFSIRLPIQYPSKLRLFQISGYLVWVEIFLRPPADWIKVKIKKNKKVILALAWWIQTLFNLLKVNHNFSKCWRKLGASTLRLSRICWSIIFLLIYIYIYIYRVSDKRYNKYNIGMLYLLTTIATFKPVYLL